MRTSRRFWFLLAVTLGSTVGELQARMGSHEFSEWQALFAVEPFGEVRSDLRIGQLAAHMVNLARAEGDPVAYGVDMALPSLWIDRPTRTVTPTPTVVRESEQLEPGSSAETRMFLAAMGATKAG